MKTQDLSLLPVQRRLWFKVEPPAGQKKKRSLGSGPAGKEYELGYRDCAEINSALSDRVDVSGAVVLKCNIDPQKSFAGQFPRHHGFVLSPSEAKDMLMADAKNGDVVHPFFIGEELVTDGTPQRWVIDFQQMPQFEARSYQLPWKRIEETVLPHISEYAQKERQKTGKETGQDQNWLRTWWQHFRCRKEMIDSISALSRFIACPEITKRPIFAFIHPVIRPDHRLRVFAFGDDYSFGILQSSAHWLWFITKCAKLTERFTYTSSTVFDMFPWPQSASAKQIEAVAKAGREVRRVRVEALSKITGGLRAVYRTLELPGANPLKDAHATLDAAVLAAYGFSPKNDLLAQLLDLNHTVAHRLTQNEPVTAPGIPPDYPHPESLVTEDCIRP